MLHQLSLFPESNNIDILRGKVSQVSPNHFWAELGGFMATGSTEKQAIERVTKTYFDNLYGYSERKE
jgi:hypothetical protein